MAVYVSRENKNKRAARIGGSIFLIALEKK